MQYLLWLVLFVHLVQGYVFQNHYNSIMRAQKNRPGRLFNDISAASIKELRDKSGAGFLDCKKALVTSNGDINIAIDLLRKQGVILAAKKGHRVTSTGLVASATSFDKGRGYLVEVCTETDFVVKNDIFVNLVSAIASAVAQSPIESIRNVSDIPNLVKDGRPIRDWIVDAIAKTGEFITIPRMTDIALSSPGFVATYVHGTGSDIFGKIGVLVGIHCEDKGSSTISKFGRDIGMHIAAQAPEALNVADIDPIRLNREREIIMHQVQQAAKSPAFVDKQVEGKLRKYYEQVALLEQKLDMDPKLKMRDFVAGTIKSVGAAIDICGFRRMVVGEGYDEGDKDVP